MLGSKSCVQRWKGKKTYDNKTGEHTGGRRPMLYTSKLNNFGSRESQSATNKSGSETRTRESEWIGENVPTREESCR